MFKKGDEVQRKDGTPFSNGEHVVTVKEVVGNDVFLKGLGTYIDYSHVKKVTTPRPHAEVIKAWADDDSVVVETYTDGKWVESLNPVWCQHLEYRIKPEKSEVDERIEALEAELMALKKAREAESR